VLDHLGQEPKEKRFVHGGGKKLSNIGGPNTQSKKAKTIRPQGEEDGSAPLPNAWKGLESEKRFGEKVVDRERVRVPKKKGENGEKLTEEKTGGGHGQKKPREAVKY